jgi:hypothetical protein
VPEFHAEPYVYLAGLSHKSALIAWGAFYFRTRSNGMAKLVDDDDLQWVHPPRCDSIGCQSKFLLVTIDGDRMTVRAIGEEEGGVLKDIERFDPESARVSGPIALPTAAPA